MTVALHSGKKIVDLQIIQRILLSQFSSHSVGFTYPYGYSLGLTTRVLFLLLESLLLFSLSYY